jgi:hypothetical protein
LALAACGGDDEGSNDDLPAIAQLSAAQGAALSSCSALAAFAFPNTVINAASVVPAGTLGVAGNPIGEHCLVTGRMNERVSAVDGQAYAIRFEMRLPDAWNGRSLRWRRWAQRV